MEYGVQTHNKFAFLDDDATDTEDALTKIKIEEKKSATTIALQPKKLKSNVVNKPVVSKDTVLANEKKETSGDQVKPAVRFRDDKNNREQGQQNRGGPRPPRRFHQNNQNDVEQNTEKRMHNDRPLRAENNIEGGENRRRGPPRQGGGPRRPFPRDGNLHGGQRFQRSNEPVENKTEENKSIEGEDKIEEKSVGDDVAAEVQQKTNDENNLENNGQPEQKNDEAENDEEQPVREKTYEEWKAEMNQKNVDAAHFNTRKPGEGDDQKIYQKLIPLKKEDSKKKMDEIIDEAQHKEKREKPLSFDVSFVDKRSGFGSGRPGFGNERNGGGPPRGDRPQGGGGRGAGGPRGPPRSNNYANAGPSRRPQNKQVQGGFMLVNEQFPALGASR